MINITRTRGGFYVRINRGSRVFIAWSHLHDPRAGVANYLSKMWVCVNK